VTDEPVDAAILAKPDRLAQVLARQKPRWEPGTRYAYHAFTLGWYEGELIRRVDPQHRTLGRFFQDEIAKPLGLEFYIGLPVEILQSRIAQLKFPSPLDYFFRTNKMSRPFLKSMGRRKSLAARAFTHAKDFDPRDRAFLALENPAFTGIGQVRSMARAYSAFATGGCELGITPRTLAALTSPPVPPTSGMYDEMLRLKVAYSLGYLRQCPNLKFGITDKAFGTPGAGGGFGFADPDAQVGFAYAPNRMGLCLFDDPREKVLRDTFYHCVKKLPETEAKRAA
jgi:CubicO group peptidase (beta-lactamase class C family)